MLIATGAGTALFTGPVSIPEAAADLFLLVFCSVVSILSSSTGAGEGSGCPMKTSGGAVADLSEVLQESSGVGERCAVKVPSGALPDLFGAVTVSSGAGMGFCCALKTSGGADADLC